MPRPFFYTIMLTCLLFSSLNGYSEEPEFVLNRWQDINKGEKLTFYENDLENQMMEIRKPTPKAAINMSISLDGGYSWNDMNQRANYYVYRYRPLNQEVMHVMFSWTDTNGLTNTSDTGAYLTFIPND